MTIRSLRPNLGREGFIPKEAYAIADLAFDMTIESAWITSGYLDTKQFKESVGCILPFLAKGSVRCEQKQIALDIPRLT